MANVRKNAIRDENNFDGKTISLDIVNNRRRIEKKLAARYDITPEILAEYFQVPLKTINKDIKESNIQFTGKMPFVVNVEKNTMRNKIFQKVENGMDRQDVLTSFGMWSDVVLFGEKVEISLRGLDTKQLSRMQKALDLCGYGYSQSDITKMTKITVVEKELVKSQLEEGESLQKSLGGGVSLSGAMEFAKDRFQKGEDSKDINKATGVPVVALEKTNYFEYKERYRDAAREKYKRKDGKENEYSKNKNVLKEEAYKRWTNRECTQQELAEEYGVTRITIMNWCREMKAKHMVERPEMSLRQRNIKRELKEQRDVQKQTVISSYAQYTENGMGHSEAILKISGDLKIGYDKALNFLREEGKAPTSFERNPGSEQTKKEDKYFKDGYDKGVMAHFGYGPNEGKSGYNVDEFGNKSISDKYAEIHFGQRQVSYEIANSPSFTSHVRENDGIIGDYWNKKRVSNTVFSSANSKKTLSNDIDSDFNEETKKIVSKYVKEEQSFDKDTTKDDR